MIKEDKQFRVNYDPKKTKAINSITANLKKYVQVFNKFFGIKPQVNVQLVYDRKEYDFYSGTKSENWMSGYYNGKMVIVFDPDSFEKETCHKKEEFPGTLKHETAHVYICNLARGRVPAWLNEGLASHLGQGKGKEYFNMKSADRKGPILNVNKNKDNRYVWYTQAPCFVEFLIKKKGKEGILELIKESRNELDKTHSMELASDKSCIKVYNQNIKELNKEWLNYIKK